uniref:Uncharacterized protein n=1 Tax=Oryza sativa subsp. japonica TaxID=39947 RepID=Q6Z439_ORYSJ|nr:hypothetical protein [Oryza sativa Japonica Group]
MELGSNGIIVRVTSLGRHILRQGEQDGSPYEQKKGKLHVQQQQQQQRADDDEMSVLLLLPIEID